MRAVSKALLSYVSTKGKGVPGIRAPGTPRVTEEEETQMFSIIAKMDMKEMTRALKTPKTEGGQIVPDAEL